MVITSLNVNDIAAKIGKIKIKPNFKLPGFITINTPINPIISANHLLIPIISFSKIIEKRVFFCRYVNGYNIIQFRR